MSGLERIGGRTLAVPALRADATRISVEFTVTLLREGDGAIAGIAAIIRDVTEQWEERRGMQQRVAEVERALADRGTGAAE